jgi:hypothetical protein
MDGTLECRKGLVKLQVRRRQLSTREDRRIVVLRREFGVAPSGGSMSDELSSNVDDVIGLGPGIAIRLEWIDAPSRPRFLQWLCVTPPLRRFLPLQLSSLIV